MNIIFTALSLFVIISTSIPFIKSTHWSIRSFDFPRAQIFTIGFITLLLGIFTYGHLSYSNLILFALLLLAVCYQAKKIIPFVPLHPCESIPDNQKPTNTDHYIGIMVANVLMDNQNVEKLLLQVNNYQPDVFLAVETNQWWENALVSLHEDYPYRISCPQDNLYGMHLYSKYELRDHTIEFLIEKDIPSIHASLEFKNGHEIRVFCVHPAPPSPTENSHSDERDQELILTAHLVAKDKRACIVLGDLNDVAWSKTTRKFKEISGLQDPRIGRGMFSSYNAKYWPFRWPLDHIFHSNDFALHKIKRLDDFGSDHFPLYVKLRYIKESK